jgi:hypothetical protein
LCIRQAILAIPSRVQGDLPHMVPSEVEVIKRQCRERLAELKRLGSKPRPKTRTGARGRSAEHDVRAMRPADDRHLLTRPTKKTIRVPKALAAFLSDSRR